MFVYRYKEASTVDPSCFHAAISELQDGIHYNDASIVDAPQKTNNITMFQYLFKKAIGYQLPGGVDSDDPESQSQPESADSGMALTPNLGDGLTVENLHQILSTDSRWELLDIDPSRLQEGDVLFAIKRDATAIHEIAIATLTMGPAMLLVTGKHLDAPSIMATAAFMEDYEIPTYSAAAPRE